jgi:hypothetical protein
MSELHATDADPLEFAIEALEAAGGLVASGDPFRMRSSYRQIQHPAQSAEASGQTGQCQQIALYVPF